MLYHVYASLDEAKQFLKDEGDAWGSGSTNDARALSLLASVSRRVDDWCRRSNFGSGFGPRLGTNRYNAEGGTSLDFHDDLLTTTSVVSRASTGSATTTAPAADTDFYLVNQQGGYEPGPYRRSFLHGQGDVTAFGSGFRIIEWAGSWGFEDRRLVLTATLDGAVADGVTTTIPVSALDEFSVGQTHYIDSEQVFVEGLTVGEDTDPDTLTVVRGVNGTTAAAHLDEAAIALCRYDPRVVDATLRLFVRRWRGRTAGSDGMDGNSDLGMIVAKESEDTILRRSLAELKLMGAVVF